MSKQLFDECIAALGANVKILTQNQGEDVFDALEFIYPITSWGRIDWEKVEEKVTLKSIDQIPRAFSLGKTEKDLTMFVLWNNASFSVIKSKLSKVLEAIDDVVVGSDTWLFNPSVNCVIEFYHEGELTIGNGKNVQNFLQEKYKSFFGLSSQFKSVSPIGLELSVAGKKIDLITNKLLNNKKLSVDESTFLDTKNLYSSAWLASDGKKYPLMNEPETLKYAKAIEDLKQQCKGMIAYNKSIDLLKDP